VVTFAHSGRDDVALSRKEDPIYRMNHRSQGVLKRWIQQHYPDQIYQSQHGALLFFTPVTTIMLARMNMLPPNPWTIGGGYSDCVTLIGEEDRDRYIEMGVVPEKLVVTGQPSLDPLYKASCGVSALRATLIKKYGLDADRKLLICAVPQLAEHGVLDWTTHWREIRFLIGALAQTGANVLLSLHPKSQPEQYRFLEGEYGVKILQESLGDVLPTADVFTATFSSTVRWAVLLGIPTLVFDFYNFNYDIFDHLAGVVKVTDKALLTDTLCRMLADPAWYEQLQRNQLQAARQIALFDGQANRRIIDLIDGHTKQGAG
jgi:glycosyltransferase involved in cell wall biosynthesis